MQKLYFYLYLLIFIFLALPMIKVGTPRVEQLLVLGTFVIIFIDDVIEKDVDVKILFFLIVGALVMILISMNSSYPKIDEKNYYIKFLIIYPIAFYVGARAVSKLSATKIVSILDYTLLFYVISWFIVMYVPVPVAILYKVVHLREFGWGAEFLPIQGTFYEAGALGIIVGVILTFSVFLRYKYDLWSYKYYTFVLYFFTLFMIVMSKNKTVWLSYVLILLFLVLYKGYLFLTKTNYYFTKERLYEDKILSQFLKINSTYLVMLAIALIITFFLYNTFAPTPFITMEEFQYKLQHERGAQYAVAWNLIVESNLFGGYGFGFVESYFKDLNILGVGEGSGSINSIILDIWVHGSIFGVIYLLAVFYLGFNNQALVTMIVPLYIFFFGLTNPIVSEEFFLFLGLSYGLSMMIKEESKYVDTLRKVRY